MEELGKEKMRDLIKKAELMQPSERFLQNVMNEVHKTTSHNEAIYQPLISKKGWGLIVIAIISILIVVFQFSEHSVSIFDKLGSYFPNLNLQTDVSVDFKFYDTSIYGILFLMLMFFIQITFLKKKLDTTFYV